MSLAVKCIGRAVNSCDCKLDKNVVNSIYRAVNCITMAVNGKYIAVNFKNMIVNRTLRAANSKSLAVNFI